MVDPDTPPDPKERRQFPRLRAPIYFRPAHRRLPRRQVVNVGLGGMRVYTDDAMRVGERLEIEMLLPDGQDLTCLAEVVWIRDLPSGSPAAYDLGLSFLDVPEQAREQLEVVLASAPVDDED